MREFSPKDPCVYILASAPNGILYTGVTSDIHGRMAEHKQGLCEGFAKKYGVKRLVYYEMHDTMDAAILRETRIKKWKRAWNSAPHPRDESGMARSLRRQLGRPLRRPGRCAAEERVSMLKFVVGGRL